MVSRRTLVAISAFVWTLAGFNILRLGVLDYAGNLSMLTVVLTLLIFAVFGTMFFRIVTKNVSRIVALPTDHNGFWHFFTPRMYILIVSMMSFGIFLHSQSAVPSFFIAFFYTGLGAALALAGLRYAYYVVRYPALQAAFAKGGVRDAAS